MRDVTVVPSDGIYHMPWMRGTLDAPKGPGQTASASCGPVGTSSLWSPNWMSSEWTARYIVEYAKIQRQQAST